MNYQSTTTRVSMSLRAIGCELIRRVGAPQAERNPRFRFSCCGYAIFLVLSLVAAPCAWGQQQATLSGVVRDPSSANIPGTTIRVTNVNTQVTVETETNSTGYYVVSNLIPAVYTVTAQKGGFKTATRADITLQVAQSATVDFQLELGQTSQEVSVHGSAPLVERSDATVGK